MRLASRILVALVMSAAGLAVGHGPSVRAAGSLQTLVVTGGQPDDVTTDTRGRLVWGDLGRGTLERLDGRRIVILARGLSVPEGVVSLPDGSFVVAEQGRDRIVRIGRTGGISVLYTLRPVSGQEGVDSIGRDPRNGDLLVPDSPNGTVLRMSANGRNVRTIARGLGRPVDAAVDPQGNMLIPDEHLGTLVVVAPNGRISYRGTLSTPDDVVVSGNGRAWITTLGDGGLWVTAPGGLPRRVLVGLANPQGLTLDRCGDPIIVEQNTARIVRLLLTRRSTRCAL